MSEYIVSVDQSTQGTKALLFNDEGKLLYRCDLPHEQKINENGWVSHDPVEIYRNTVKVVGNLISESGISPEDVVCVGISNQRETALVWDKLTGLPIADAVVWQCSRGSYICERESVKSSSEYIREHTGLNLSPYFSAAKIAWVLENTECAEEKIKEGRIACGTVDSWLVYKLTGGKEFKTDYSNASRTQLFDIRRLCWDEKICSLFGVPVDSLPEVCMSDSLFGYTTFEGLFPQPVPIHSVMGDSHGALFGQGCLTPGTAKATYGTGSSIMMNVGDSVIESRNGLVSSIAWGMNGSVTYVLEGNINYTGAVISWLKDDVKLISSASEAESLAVSANPEDTTYIVPAFSGLGAPYWDDKATAVISGITRLTGKNEIVRAALDCIAHQITDVVSAMTEDSGYEIAVLNADGGPTRNAYLMQFQADMLNSEVSVPQNEELSGIGAAYAAGIAFGLYSEDRLFSSAVKKTCRPSLREEIREEKREGWRAAVKLVLGRK